MPRDKSVSRSGDESAVTYMTTTSSRSVVHHIHIHLMISRAVGSEEEEEEEEGDWTDKSSVTERVKILARCDNHWTM